jgi:CRP/FNR family transcriptional regulator
MTKMTLADAAAYAPGASLIRAPAGRILFRPNDVCRGFLAVRSGVIRVGLTAANGREVVLYRVGPAEICLQTFACLVEGKAYAAEGVAQDDIEALLIPSATFNRLLTEDAGFRTAVLTSVANRFSEFEQVVQALAFTDLETRVASALIRLAMGTDRLYVTHAQLAAEIGSAREVVSRQLGQFSRRGLVSLSRGQIVFRQPETLTRMAETPV